MSVLSITVPESWPPAPQISLLSHGINIEFGTWLFKGETLGHFDIQRIIMISVFILREVLSVNISPLNTLEILKKDVSHHL